MLAMPRILRGLAMDSVPSRDEILAEAQKGHSGEFMAAMPRILLRKLIFSANRGFSMNVLGNEI